MNSPQVGSVLASPMRDDTCNAKGDSVTDAEKVASRFPLVVAAKAVVLCVVIVGAAVLCRFGGLEAYSRCLVVIGCVLLLGRCEIMPLSCVALFIPILGTSCAVLGDTRGTVETSVFLMSSFFNNISFMILGVLVINGIFIKCCVVERIAESVLKRFRIDSAVFLLLLMLGSMAACSILYSGSILLLAAVKPMLKASDVGRRWPDPVVKRLLLGIAFASNAGSTWLPISSPVNLVTIGILEEFNQYIPLWSWILVSVPFSTLLMVGAWAVLVIAFPCPTEAHPPTSSATVADTFSPTEERNPLTRVELFFLFVGCVAVVGTIFSAKELEPTVGHPVFLSLALVTLALGSGFMSREEFLQLEWHLLATVGGSNVMGFLVRETALGATLSAMLASFPWVQAMHVATFFGFLLCTLLVLATFLGHSLSGVLLMPLVVAVGVKLQAVETMALLCALAIPCGMGLPQSSFDNQASLTASRALGDNRRELKQRDFAKVGVATSVIALVLLMTWGFGICIMQFGLPPPSEVSSTRTPEALIPRVIRENMPTELCDVRFNKQIVHWMDFTSRPGRKAFAVSSMGSGNSTRAWAAAWNHQMQADANAAALHDCQTIAEKCRIIYPLHAAQIAEKEREAAIAKAKADAKEDEEYFRKFLQLRGQKALVKGDLESTSQVYRVAVWNYATQIEANTAAMKKCRAEASGCSFLYPADESDGVPSRRRSQNENTFLMLRGGIDPRSSGEGQKYGW
eukprot:TRINITY_DN16984_c0_g1_i1.p1 TRINITY_DN16984_c0_g1~~TRINITY_DN16984_c0_g1_i1.p1  ORF type:complete len:741 (-),score=131.95 TRINITY_DN16984_c0_g1_i1:30-2252(-)